MEDQRLDDSKRRAFTPRPARKRRQRPALPKAQFNLWHLRQSFGIGLARAGCAVGFGFVPALGSRFGDSALAVAAFVLALGVAGIVLLLYRSNRPIEWTLMADAVTLLVLVPVLASASGIEVADARFGGRSLNFLAAATAVVLLYVVIVVIATRGGQERNAGSQIGVLPGALSITAILLGTASFSAAAMWRGLAIAWMVAAIVTVIAVIVPQRYRLFVAPAAFLVFAAAIVLPDALRGEGTSLSTGSSAIAVVATGCVAAILVFIPVSNSAPVNEPPPDHVQGK
jgi:hypothetical protein